MERTIESGPEPNRVELFSHLSWDERQALADRLEQIQHNFEAIFKKNGWLPGPQKTQRTESLP